MASRPLQQLHLSAIVAVAVLFVREARAEQQQANDAVVAAVLAENLDVSLFGGRVLLCPAPFAATREESMCTCGAGWTRTHTGVCAQCPAGFFKEDAGAAACTECPVHMTSFEGAETLSDCMCAAGYFAAHDACEPCAAGTYKGFRV